METDPLRTEFRYLLVRVGKKLKQEDCEAIIFVHKIPESSNSSASDLGLHLLSTLEAEDYFDPLHPDKLQELLGKIGRKDLAQDIKDYKQTSTFKKAAKLESEREKKNYKKKTKTLEKSDVQSERYQNVTLHSEVEMNSASEEIKWKEVFPKILSQTAQLEEPIQQLQSAIKLAMEGMASERKSEKKIEDALDTIHKAQDKVKSLSKTLEKAITATTGFTSQKVPRLEEDHHPKTKGLKLEEDHDPKTKGLRLEEDKTKGTPPPTKKKPIMPPGSKLQYKDRSQSYHDFRTEQIPPGSTPTFSPTHREHQRPPPVKAKPKPTKLRTDNTFKNMKSTPPATATPPGSATPTHKEYPLIKAKPAKLRSLTIDLPLPPDNISRNTSSNPLSVHGSTTSFSSSYDDESAHIYDSADTCKQETEVIYMNTHVALSGIGRGSGGKKVQRSSSQTSSTSIQVDSGLGHEDKTWGGELINLPPEENQYMNLPLLTDEEHTGEPNPLAGKYTSLITRTKKHN